MSSSSTSCFLHIPKTGGSWLSAALRSSLPPQAFYEVPSDRVGDVPVALLLERHAVVAGHFTMADLRPVLDTTFTFTVLRDPIDRVVSLYHFYREQSAAPHYDPRVADTKTHEFEAFVDHLEERVSPWSNWQTFLLSGAVDCETPPGDLLPAARENLQRINLVGVQDELADTLSSLAAARGWQLTPPAGKVNATRHRLSVADVSPSTIQKLQALNAADVELYRLARERSPSRRNRVDAAAGPSISLPPSRVRERGTKQIIITGAHADTRGGKLIVQAQSAIDATNVTVGIQIRDAAGIVIYGINTRLLGQEIAVAAGSVLEVVFHLNLQLANGEYEVTAAVHEGADHLERCYHWVDAVARFVCHAPHTHHFLGIVDLKATAETRRLA